MQLRGFHSGKGRYLARRLKSSVLQSPPFVPPPFHKYQTSSSETSHSATWMKPRLLRLNNNYTPRSAPSRNIFQPASSSQPRVAPALRHVPESRETWGTSMQTLMGYVQPRTSRTESQLGSILQMVWYIPQKPNLLSAVGKSLPFTKKPPSSTSKRVRLKWEISVTDHVKCKSVAKRSCSACFLFKVLFYFLLQWSGSRSVAFYPLYGDPTAEERCLWALAQLSSRPEERQEGRGRERGQMGRENQKKYNISDLEHKLLLLKAVVKPGVFFWDTETTFPPDISIWLSSLLVRKMPFSPDCTWYITKNTDCLGWLYVCVCVCIFKRNIMMLKRNVCSSLLTP